MESRIDFLNLIILNPIIQKNILTYGDYFSIKSLLLTNKEIFGNIYETWKKISPDKLQREADKIKNKYINLKIPRGEWLEIAIKNNDIREIFLFVKIFNEKLDRINSNEIIVIGTYTHHLDFSNWSLLVDAIINKETTLATIKCLLVLGARTDFVYNSHHRIKKINDWDIKEGGSPLAIALILQKNDIVELLLTKRNDHYLGSIEYNPSTKRNIFWSCLISDNKDGLIKVFNYCENNNFDIKELLYLALKKAIKNKKGEQCVLTILQYCCNNHFKFDWTDLFYRAIWALNYKAALGMHELSLPIELNEPRSYDFFSKEYKKATALECLIQKCILYLPVTPMKETTYIDFFNLLIKKGAVISDKASNLMKHFIKYMEKCKANEKNSCLVKWCEEHLAEEPTQKRRCTLM